MKIVIAYIGNKPAQLWHVFQIGYIICNESLMYTDRQETLIHVIAIIAEVLNDY